ncbi:MAG TPA: IS200/IS605 family transposase [Anaerolineae bacterium]|nr:IS200/IS605 family transposase [Anaerolineae bacterium]
MPKQTTPPARVYYHVTFQTRRRIPAIYDEVEAYFREVVPQIAKQGEFVVLEVGVVPTHVHLLIEKAPWADLVAIVHAIQDSTSTSLLEHFPELALDLKADRFWTDGYHYERHTQKSLETVRRYIRDQKRHHGLA